LVDTGTGRALARSGNARPRQARRLRSGTKNPAPADIGNRKTHEADHNANSIERILAEFRTERDEFVRRLDEYDAAFAGRTALHPRLNLPMRVIDLIFFIAEHDDHHLARITDLIRSR
jgi:uncharacterized damage-inducible protein DinB